MNKQLVLAACAALVLSACTREPAGPAPAANGDYGVRGWELFAGPGSMAPDLSVTADGRVLLSWLSRQQGRRTALQFASYTEAGGWQSPPRTIAVGNSLVANWADVPHVRATPDGAWWAQWLQSNATSPAGYDAVLARSRDGGMTWTQITRINNDQTGAEHGFAALWPVGQDRLGVAWLDGRDAASASGADSAHAHGAMQLRSNQFDMQLERGEDLVLDDSTCECCQTDVAMTAQGPLLVYRGRADGEVRDIMAMRHEDGTWLAPKPVHADGWKTEACPVNGPAVAARAKMAVVAWYSEADGTPTVRIARSTDAGDTFAAPVVVETGDAVLGQVDVAIDGAQAWVSWLRETAGGQVLMLARYSPDLSRPLQQLEVATLKARGHASGSPRLVVDAGGAWVVWTDASDGVSQLQGARIAP